MNDIVFVIPSLSAGGAEHQVCNQVNYLYKNNYPVKLIVLSDKIDIINLINLPEENITILGLKHLRKTSKLSFLQINTAIKVINNQCNVNTVLISVLPISHFISRLSKFWFNSKYRLVCYHRSIQYENSPNNTLFKLLYYRVNKSLSKRYDDEHLFISDAVEKHISKYFEVKNGHVIFNAIPEKEISLDKSQKDLLQFFPKKPTFLVVIPGRLHKTKGHSFFIKGLHEYIKKYNVEELGVIFLGGGPIKDKLKKLIHDKGLEKHIVLTDYIENDLLLSYVLLSDLVVIPSISEGFGNVAIEALMLGKTALVSDSGGLKEIITDKKNGFIFKKLNAEALLYKFSMIHQGSIKLPEDILKKDFKNRFTLESQIEKLIKALETTQL